MSERHSISLPDPETAFRIQVSYAFSYSPFYRSRFLDAGISEQEIEYLGLADVERFPIVEAQDLREHWREMSVIGENAFRATTSGGTTGMPKLMVRTRSDWALSVDSHVRVLEIGGLRRHHRLLIALPFDCWCVGFLTMDACREIGCMAIPVGVRMDDEAVLDFVDRFDVNAVVASPSRWAYLTTLRPDLCRRRKGLLMLLAGEPISDRVRDMLSAVWQGKVRSLYGSEETDGLGCECGQGAIGCHILTDRFLFEVIGSDCHKPQINSGKGELIITSLYHQGTPLIRYRLGDIVEISTEACPCGRQEPKVRVLGKADEMLVFRDATRLFGYQLEEVLFSAIAMRGEFQAIARNESNGREVLEVRLGQGVDIPNESDLVIEALLHSHPDIADSVSMGMLRVLVTRGSFEGCETTKGKRRRFVDLR